MKSIPSITISVIAIIVLWMSIPSWAEEDRGFYLSYDLGVNISPSVSFDGDSNDVASHCDALTNPGLMGCNPDDFRYTGRFVKDWASTFDGGAGILTGAAVGYRFADRSPDNPLGGFRVEMEYFFRESQHDQTKRVGKASGATLDKIQRNEFADGPNERLGSITSHNLFGNLYYDLPVTNSRFTPYIGIGGGVGVTDADWGSNWTRTMDKDNLRSGLTRDGRPDLANNATYVDRLAGSSSVAHTTLRDTLYGFQVMIGGDYAFTDTMSLGLKGRYVRYDAFSDAVVWDPLRSHAPYVGANNTNPVSGHMSTSDIEFIGVTLNVKYRF